MPLQFQTSQKGKPQLLVNGHLFSFHKTLVNGNRAWKCTKCKSRVHTDHNDSNIVKQPEDHDHAADAAKVKAIAVVNELRQRARGTEDAPHQLIAAVTAGNNSFLSRAYYSIARFSFNRNQSSRCSSTASS
jgi:FLYWCH zinc finger domain